MSEASTPRPAVPAQAGAAPVPATRPAGALAIPAYLEQLYWWAYVHPRAVRLFERGWLVNLILFGNYARLRTAALAELGQTVAGATLQVACVYGDLTPRLRQRIAPDGQLHVVDVLPIQLQNLAAKLPPDPRVTLLQRDSSALGLPDASYDQVLLFFLLHEQPEAVRRRTLAEVWRVVRPGGRIVLVDYHAPRRGHPLGRPLRALLRKLEPFAEDLFQHPLLAFFPPEARTAAVSKQTYFGGLYQKLVLTR
jgi:ubiquinone/menaquinone biosynthesis C-methylase UbiE